MSDDNKVQESRGHKIIATKLANLERWKNTSFADKDKKEEPPFDPDKPHGKIAVAGKYGYGPSAARHLARQGLKSVTDEKINVADEKKPKKTNTGELEFHHGDKVKQESLGGDRLQTYDDARMITTKKKVKEDMDNMDKYLQALDENKGFRDVVEENTQRLDEVTSQMQKLRDALSRHSEKAIAANKAGNDEAVKVHQAYMNKIKTKMGKLAKNESVELGEEIEVLDELSKKTLGSYVNKASHSAANKMYSAGYTDHMSHTERNKGNDALAQAHSRHAGKSYSKSVTRLQGIGRASKKLAKEEAEQIDESDSYGSHKQNAKEYKKEGDLVAHHLELHSYYTKHADKAEYDKKHRGGAGSYSANLAKAKAHLDAAKEAHKTQKTTGFYRAKDLLGEETEQLDELSNKTLGNYAKRAASQSVGYAAALGAMKTADSAIAAQHKLRNRHQGVQKAISKMMAKEEIEQMDEAKLTHSIYRVNVHYDHPSKNYDKGHRVTVSRGGDEEAKVRAAVKKHLGDEPHTIRAIQKGQFSRKYPEWNKDISEDVEQMDEGYRLPSDSETAKVKAHVKANHPDKTLSQVAVDRKTKKIEYVVKDKDGKMSGHVLESVEHDEIEEALKPGELSYAADRHFSRQSPKMQDAINLHLRRGKSYREATELAKKHVKEELHGNQKKIDVNHNGKLDADDFKRLRATKEELHGNQHKLDVNNNGKLDKDDFKQVRKAKDELGLKLLKWKNQQRAAKALGEDIEQIDELSKDTLKSYTNKAEKDYLHHMDQAKKARDEYSKTRDDKDFNAAHEYGKKSSKRNSGLFKAGARLHNDPHKLLPKGTAQAYKEEFELDEQKEQPKGKTPVKPIPGQLSSHAVLVHKESKRRVVVPRCECSKYPAKEGWEEAQFGVRKEEVEHITEADIESIKAQYKKNEDDNKHSENAALLAKHFGTKRDQNKANKALAYRDQHGGYGNDPLGRHHSKASYEVHKKYIHHISEEVEELDERNKENATMRKNMDASRGLRAKVLNPAIKTQYDDAHQTQVAQNKALGRALRKEDVEYINEAHEVHVNDGSKYDEEPHEKDVEHVNAGVKKHGGKFAGHTDKGVIFSFGNKTDAENFRRHVNACPKRSCSADHLDEEVKLEEKYDHGPIDRETKVRVGHKAAVLAGSGIDSGKHGTVVGQSRNHVGDQWHIKTADGEVVKMYKNRVAKLKEETEELDELNKPTLASYAKKAHGQLMKHTGSVNFKYGRGDKDAFSYEHDPEAMRKTKNREKGLETAVNKLAKEEAMISYKDFVATLGESKIDDLKDKLAARKATMSAYDKDYKPETKKEDPKRTVKGHSYGAGQEDDDEEGEKKKPAEPEVKRGRGRPAGSKSGARR